MAGAQTNLSGVAGRYASALFELAEGQKAIDAVHAELTALDGLISENADLERMITSPLISAEEQEGAFSAILSKAGVKGLTANFVRLVAQNRRLFALPGMIRAFGELVAAHKGEVTAEVTAAHELTDKQTAALQKAIKASVGQDIAITTQVDPSILGGIIVKVGSKMIDASLKTKLNSLKFAMKEVG